MASISLRSYNKEIEHLIDQGQVDEAIGHCMHILQSVPKHLGTYRLLGKALLESKRYSDATDIFQRILSAVPDDFVANVGMSIIRENEKNLDMAIWHMERAFENQPANAVVQDELRRLYGRRDGIEPPKIRLTRGALARMYVRGHLYRQAIGELRAALVEDPQRPDLQVLLAEMYFQNGQKVEAVDTCSTLLKKYPFCYEANRILAAILPETERKEDAGVYLQRVISLDPYYGKLADSQTSSDQVPDQVITLEKLSYQAGQNLLQAPAQPDWATSLGAAFETPKVTDALPDWLTAPEEGGSQVSEETGPAPVGEAVPTETLPPEGEDIPDWFSQGEPPSQTMDATGEEKIPEFLKDAGWGPSTGSFDEAAASQELKAEEAPGEGISKAEIPDWLQQMAPPEIEQEPPAEAELAAELPPWLQENPPGSSDTIISWLKTVPKEGAGKIEEELPAVEEPEADVETPPETAGESWPQGEDVQLPDWLSEQNQQPTGVTGMLPSWLPENQIPVVADSEAGLASEPAAEIPDWLQGIENEITPPAHEVEEAPEEAAPSEPAPEAPGEDWITKLGQPSAVSEESQLEPSVPDELTEWLKSLEATPGLEETPAEEPPLTWEAAIAEVSKTEEAPAEAVPTEEIPDWLKPGEAEALIPEEGMPETEPVSSEETIIAEPATEAFPEPGEVLAEEPVIEEIPDWLKGLETMAPVEEQTPIEGPIAPVEEVVPAETEPAPETVLPDWLAEIETAAVPAEETAPVVPDMLEDTKPRVIKLPPEPQPTEAPETAVPSAEAAFNLEDPDAAMAWLESLAAQQGIPQEQLTTTPEERPLTPEWLEQAGQEAAARGELTTYVPTETTQAPQAPGEPEIPPAEQPTLITPIKTSLTPEPEPEPKPAEEIPDWLIGIETAAVSAEQTIPAVIEEPVRPLEEEVIEETIKSPVEPAKVEEVPGWLEEEIGQPAAEIEPESATQPSQVEPVAESAFNLEDPDAALAWLESLAAQQGIPQDQLITAPEERPATPEWLEQAGQEAEAKGELSTYIPTETTQGMQPPVEVFEPTIEEPVTEEPTQEPVTEAEPAEEMPDWLRAMEPTEPVQITPSEEEIPELAPDWLQEFEAIAGQKEAEPSQTQEVESVSEEELPGWLQEELPEEEEPAPSAMPEAPTWISEEQPLENVPLDVEPAPQLEPEAMPAWLEAQQKLDLNAASLRELEQLPGMGFILAQAIVAHREENGPFKEVKDLIAVQGMDEPLLNQIKDLLEVNIIPEKPAPAVIQAEPKNEDEKQLVEVKRLLANKDYANASDQLEGLLKKRLYLPEIIRELRLVVDVNPDNIYVWQSLGDAYMRSDQLQEALNAYSKAEQLLR
jgi:competence ComEA-like helix-hairpin-helix protein